MSMRRIWVLVLALTLTASLALPAAAITRGGVPDGDDHPYVGLMVAGFDVEGEFQPAWRCSGALISPTVYVTAGHCTFGADHVELWFETDLEPTPGAFGYPFEGEVSGEPFTHPEYLDEAFFLYDLGVVVLDEPVHLAGGYASLPEVDELEQLGKGRNRAAITAVGYGLQGIVPQGVDLKTRYRADLFVVNATGFIGLKQVPGSGYFATSSDAKHGGTCFGDSGGPVLRGGTDTILGVTSFGITANCTAPGGAYRIDRTPDLRFINDFLKD
jgi:hypothetical protein